VDRRHHRLRAQVLVRAAELTAGARRLGEGLRRWSIKTLKTSCPGGAHESSGLRIWCPDCHRPTISWLHVALVAALDAAGLVYLLRLF
jgi:hypothetical protein